MRIRPPVPPPPFLKGKKTSTPNTLKPPMVKVCGITRVDDARFCLSQGVRYIGLNRYSESPRFVPDAQLEALIDAVPAGRRVYVDVNPGLPELHDAQLAGFDIFQLHFDPAAVDEQRLRMWKDKVGAENLWLAPRLKGGTPPPPAIFGYAKTFLIDGYSPGAFGGTGKTADWAGIAALRSLHRDKTWVVAGGLNPTNIVEAVKASFADIVDLNSGVESAPGVKDAALLAKALDRLDREIGRRD